MALHGRPLPAEGRGIDAIMVSTTMKRLDLDALDALALEKMGKIICPASYDLGEEVHVVLLSVTKGEDKPLRYPVMFRTGQVVVI